MGVLSTDAPDTAPAAGGRLRASSGPEEENQAGIIQKGADSRSRAGEGASGDFVYASLFFCGFHVC